MDAISLQSIAWLGQLHCSRTFAACNCVDIAGDRIMLFNGTGDVLRVQDAQDIAMPVGADFSLLNSLNF